MRRIRTDWRLEGTFTFKPVMVDGFLRRTASFGIGDGKHVPVIRVRVS